jgi:hypothetical protein
MMSISICKIDNMKENESLDVMTILEDFKPS